MGSLKVSGTLWRAFWANHCKGGILPKLGIKVKLQSSSIIANYIQQRKMNFNWLTGDLISLSFTLRWSICLLSYLSLQGFNSCFSQRGCRNSIAEEKKWKKKPTGNLLLLLLTQPFTTSPVHLYIFSCTKPECNNNTKVSTFLLTWAELAIIWSHTQAFKRDLQWNNPS